MVKFFNKLAIIADPSSLKAMSPLVSKRQLPLLIHVLALFKELPKNFGLFAPWKAS